ncbi:putative Ig domain-containing protein, partial [Cyclobacterium salsum]|uniref:putative Ig domain-containing protein n=1 Tax=Cyclobacterium salsum TaxID=2666329 RepID=UPI00192E7A73
IIGLNGEGFVPIDPGTPVVVNPIPDQFATEGIEYNFAFAETTFSDPDGNPLSYSASLSDDSPLPSWLGFDAVNRTFNGVPTISDIGTLEIMVTASDGTLSVSDLFTLSVEEQVTTSIGINSGGPQFTSGSGFVYDADNSFVGGSTYTNNNIADVSGTTDDAMYRSERHGGGASFSYNVA